MYAIQITKAYLEKLGITNVSEDGTRIYKDNKEIKITPHSDGYLRINLYDKDLYAIEYPLTHSKNAGTVVIGVHRLVYAWFNEKADANYVVDHIDNNKQNNAISNLQLLTPSENIWKDREHGVREIKCKLNKPREFYEDKLINYIKQYEYAKLIKDAKLTHKWRSYISQTQARLRYWDSHH